MRTYLASDCNTYRAFSLEGAANQAYGRRSYTIMSHRKFPAFWEVYTLSGAFVGDLTLWED